MINKSFGRKNKQNGLQLKYFYSTGNLTKEAESDIEEKMDKIFFAAAEKAFNAIVDHLSKSPSKLLYWILAVAALALVGHTKKFSWKIWYRKNGVLLRAFVVVVVVVVVPNKIPHKIQKRTKWNLSERFRRTCRRIMIGRGNWLTWTHNLLRLW
jgi:uncharacterized membrane protein YcjF (UPF0283 family)